MIRHLSAWITPVLARLPVSANQVTTISLGFGLGAAALLAVGGTAWANAAAVSLTACYVFDNCDGEIARLRGQVSTFGERYDSFTDWIVHAVFFAALGYAVAGESGAALWLWLGIAGALGASINYFVGIVLTRYDRGHRDAGAGPAGQEDAAETGKPQNFWQSILFVFRELTRADFCFIVLALALFDATWVLLPAGAAGAQVYWITQFVRSARKFHV